MPKPRFELWGESIRELGVLILVFVPLDIFVEVMKDSKQQGYDGHWDIITFFGILGFVLIVVGVEIERR